MNWVLFYEDGRTFSSRDVLPHNSPKFGLVAVAQRLDGEIMPLVGDYFTFRGRWYNHDLVGLLDQLTHYGHQIEAVRIGRYIDDVEYKKILKRIMDIDQK